MKKQKSLFAGICACIAFVVLLSGLFRFTVLADSYTSTTMRLLHYEGTVEIEDASGKPCAVMENARLNSGEAMKTAEASSASVGLDKGRIVTLDEKSRVEFKKQDGAVSMNLTEGRIFLDVSEKLGSDETMDIQTSTMAVGIRGTIVYASCEPVTDGKSLSLESADLEGLSPEKGSIISISQIGVLEGTAQITYTDNSNRQQSLSVEAGKKATVPKYSEDAEGIPEPSVSDITKEEIEGFVLNRVTSDASVIDRVQKACDVVDDIDLSELAGIYTADGDWTWDSRVTLVAQSASKYYDGQPLTRSSDILVDGLPSVFTVKAGAGGSRTDAGESENPVANYSIYNKAGEDVTRHFTNVETVSGSLLVIPAPLTIHTATAEKVYDGTPLTQPDAYVTFYKGSGSREVPWRNTSYVVTEPAGNVSYDNQTLYGICGVIWVNAANPLTGERREIQLKAGQKLTVFLSDRKGEQSIEFKIETLSENDLPEELLRLYGDNPALLQQACRDTGWNIDILRERIEALPDTPAGTAVIEQGGLVIRESESDRLMQDLTNVRITIDTEITDYNDRALGSEEAHYSSLAVDESIKVTASGSRTDVGKSINTYTIDWGTANRSNYEVAEDLGTLTVTPAPVTITTGSAEKVYDGSPLTNAEASISGLVNGESAAVTATGSITEVGSAINTYSISWDTADSSNYTVSESVGTLRVTAPMSAVTLTAASAEKTYDGTALTDSSVTAEGLPSGFTVSTNVSGSRTDVGSSDNTIDSYTIYDADGNDVTEQFPNVTTRKGTLKVTPKEITISTGSDEKEYDGTPLTNAEASVSGLVSGETVTVTATGSITDTGSAENTYSISWDSADKGNYSVSESLGTLRVTENTGAITLTAASAEKTYDGTALTDGSVTAEGLPSGFTVSADVSGSRTDAGSSDNTIDSYAIYNEDGKDVTDRFANITAENGVLTVNPLPVEFDVGFIMEEGAEPEEGEAAFVIEYSGFPYFPEWITALYEGTDEPVEPVDWDYDGEVEGAFSFTYDLPGDAKLQLNGKGYKDAGSYTLEPETVFIEGKKDNYEITFINNAIEIKPVEVTISSGSDEKVYDGETLFCDSYELSPSDPWVDGQAPVITVTGSITKAGDTPNSFKIDWNGVNPNNYKVTEKPGTLTVKPVEVVLTANCTYEYSGDITVYSYGLIVQVNNVDSSYYNVYETDENEWQITFAWGDKIYASTLLIKDDTGFEITPYHYFISGDSDNYEYSTVDQEGKFDVPPVAPESEDGDGNKMFSTFSSPDRRLPETPSEKEDPNAADKSEDDDGKQDSDEEKSAVNDPAEPAPAELMSEEDTKEEDREEEAQEEEEQEKPSEEILQEELSEEKPSEDQNIDGC